MGIKNFSFLVSALLLLILLEGCQTPSKTKKQKPSEVPTTPQVEPTPVEVEEAEKPGMPLPVAIYLGPGGLRSYAHIGVLRALQKAQVPVVAVGGAEWGAIVGALYAQTGKPNDVEWQMMKLKEDQIPEGGFFKSGLKPLDTQVLYGFLNFIFGSKDLNKGTLPFECTATDGQGLASVINGKAREQLLRCAALPPMYDIYSSRGRHWTSGAVAVTDWVTPFKAKGAKYFIYVDVTSRGNLLSEKFDSQTKALWTAIRFTSRQNAKYANAVIEVPMDTSILDFQKRKDAIAAGERAAQSAISDIAKAINL